MDGTERRRNNESSREEGVDHINLGDGSEIPENTERQQRAQASPRRVAEARDAEKKSL